MPGKKAIEEYVSVPRVHIIPVVQAAVSHEVRYVCNIATEGVGISPNSVAPQKQRAPDHDMSCHTLDRSSPMYIARKWYPRLSMPATTSSAIGTTSCLLKVVCNCASHCRISKFVSMYLLTWYLLYIILYIDRTDCSQVACPSSGEKSNFTRTSATATSVCPKTFCWYRFCVWGGSGMDKGHQSDAKARNLQFHSEFRR